METDTPTKAGDLPPGRLVFVVDDDSSVRSGLAPLLGSLGMRTESFDSADACLRCDHLDRTDAFVVDIVMPGTNGFGLQEALAGRGLDAPVVFITGHPDEQSRERARRAGAIAFLEKPLDRATLARAMARPVDDG